MGQPPVKAQLLGPMPHLFFQRSGRHQTVNGNPVIGQSKSSRFAGVLMNRLGIELESSLLDPPKKSGKLLRGQEQQEIQVVREASLAQHSHGQCTDHQVALSRGMEDAQKGSVDILKGGCLHAAFRRLFG